MCIKKAAQAAFFIIFLFFFQPFAFKFHLKENMKNIIVLNLLIFTCFYGCKKDKWNEPASVSFTFDLNRNPGMSDKLVFSDGKIVLESFTFEGDRVQGDDVYFTNTFSSGLSATMNSNHLNDLSFDIPQGTFTRISISFSTYGTNNSNHIELSGSYSSGRGVQSPLIFRYNAKETFTIIAKNSNGSNEIVLNKDNPVSPNITIDPIYWFQPVSLNLMNNAEMVDVNGTQTILIDNSTNVDIYNIVVGRIKDGAGLKF